MEPIETEALDVNDEAAVAGVYADVRSAVEGGMAALQVRRPQGLPHSCAVYPVLLFSGGCTLTWVGSS